MADIRFAPNVIDDFERPDENPILPPWYATPSWELPIELDNGGVGSPSFDPNYQAQSSWMGGYMSGPRMEVWAIAAGDAPLHDGYYFGLHNADGGGYYVRNANSVGGPDAIEIWIRSPDGSRTMLASAPGVLPTGLFTGYAPDYCLIQVIDNTISVYVSQDAGATWTFYVSAFDTTYCNADDEMYPSLGGQGGGPGWSAFGAGPIVKRASQIFRHVYNDGLPKGVGRVQE